MFLELWLLRYRAKGRNKQNVEGELLFLEQFVLYNVRAPGPVVVFSIAFCNDMS
jgi:hypothetical protein